MNVDYGTAWLAQRRPCRDVYPGGCGIDIGPPKWAHRIDGNKRADAPPHPTAEMALAACQKPDTLPEVLKILGGWENVDVSSAAHAHLNYPG
jgi:hypothetical protein